MLLFFLVFAANTALAQTFTWTGAVSTDWFDMGNWRNGAAPAGAIPDPNINVVIPGTGSITNWPTITGGLAQCRSFTAANASSFFMSGGTLEVYASWSKAAVCNVVITGGLVSFRGSGFQTISGLNTFWDLEIRNTGVGVNVNINNELTIDNDLYLTQGRFQPGAGTGSNTINIAGNMYYNGGTFQPNFGTVVFDGNADKQITGTAGGPYTFYKVVLAKSSGANALSTNGAIVCNSDLEIQQGEFVVTPQTGVELNVRQDLTVINGGALFISNTAGTSDVEVQIGRNLIDYTLSLPSRSVPSNTAIGINYTDRFAVVTFNSSSALVTQVIRGFGPVAAVNPTNSLTQGTRLPTVNISTASTVFLDNQGARVAGNLNINSGTLKLNGRTLLFGTGLANPNAGTLTVFTGGTLDCDGGSSLLLSTVDASGPLVTTSGSGTIKLVGTSNSNAVRINRDGLASRYYRIVIASGGNIEARYYGFSLFNPAGIILQAGANLHPTNNFSDGVFNETGGANPIYYLVLQNNIAGGTTISNVVFNISAGTVYNVTRPGSATGVVTMQNCAGVRSGPTYENDPTDPTPGGSVPDGDGLVTWSTLGNTYTWTGNVDNNWYTTGNWSSGVVPTAVDDAIIPTVGAHNRYPILEADVIVNNINITADRATANDPVFNTNGRNLTINGSLVKTNANGRFNLDAGSILTIGFNFSFPAAARFNAAANTTVVFAGNTSPNQQFTFDNIRVAGGLFISNKCNNMTVNNVTLSSGNLLYVNQSANLNVRGNWINEGGNFTPVGGRVLFVANTTTTRTIQSRGVPFAAIHFNPIVNVTYQLLDTLVAQSPNTGGATNGASLRLYGETNQAVTLDLNGNVIMARHIEVVANSGTNTAHFNATAGSQLFIRSGYSFTATGAGRPMVSFVGTSSNRVLVSRQGTGTYTFNMTAVAADIDAAFADFEYMDGNGINVTAATVNTTYNFSNCSFSNFTGTAGTLLCLPNQAMTVTGARFFYSGTPTAGTHFNVFRGAAGSGAATFVDYTGNFAGPVFERDPSGSVTPGNIIWQPVTGTVYWGPFATGNWNDSPSKWRDQLGNVVPVPDGTTKVVLDHTHQTGPYTVTVDALGANAQSITMNSAGQQITLTQPANATVNLQGGFEMSDAADLFISNWFVFCRGDWQMSQGTFSAGSSSNVQFTGNSMSVANGSNSFSLVTINTMNNTVTLADPMICTRNFTLTAGTLDVGTANNKITCLGPVSFNGGTFIARSGIFELQGTGTQTITNVNAQEFFNLTINKTGGQVNLSNDIYINSALTFTGSNKARINTSSNVVRMGFASAAVGVTPTGSNGYVNGKMSFKYNNNASVFNKSFTIGRFPDYLPLDLSIQLAAPVVTEFVAEQFNAAPPTRTLPVLPEEIIAHSTAHFFTVEKVGATAVTTAGIALRYNAADMASIEVASGTAVTDISTIRILKSNSVDNTIWDNIAIGGAGGYGSLLSGYVVSTTPWTTFSDFVISATPQPMPVELLSFDGIYNDASKQIDLRWQTASEHNNAGFNLYRADMPNMPFSQVASFQTEAALVGQGNSSQPAAYRFSDNKNLVPGQTYYYQLEQVDYTGNVQRTNTIAVTVPTEKSQFLAQYPNPVSAVANFQFHLETSQAVKLEVFTVNGVKVAEQTESLTSGVHEIQWKPTGLTPGIYLYRLSGETMQHGGKLVIPTNN